jgi:hypothetical protein
MENVKMESGKPENNKLLSFSPSTSLQKLKAHVESLEHTHSTQVGVTRARAVLLSCKKLTDTIRKELLLDGKKLKEAKVLLSTSRKAETSLSGEGESDESFSIDTLAELKVGDVVETKIPLVVKMLKKRREKLVIEKNIQKDIQVLSENSMENNKLLSIEIN